jgi:heat shock protein HtpX
MWQAIRDNTFRSRLLIGLMGALLVGLGYVIGMATMGPDGGVPGALGALAIWFVMLLAALAGGEQLVLMSARAKQISKEDSPRLWNVVEEMTIASGLGGMPKIYLIDNDMPNAFAAGRKPENSCVAVTSGLLRRLNRDELQGVIAHEIGHIKNLDVRFMTIAAVMLGSIVMLADLFFRMMWFGGGRRRGSGGGGQGQALFLLIAIAAAIVAPIAAQLLYFACSRKREYLADASAARFTRYPEGLASALEKISGHLVRSKSTKDVPRALAPMYIVNPLGAASGKVGLFSTHPPTQKRVDVLRAMGGMAGWVDYDRAYRQVTGEKGSGIDSRTLGAEESVTAREPTAEPDKRKDAVTRGREVADMIDRMVSFLIVACPCGVRIKIPPELKRDSVKCTRCGREHPVPHAEAAVGAAEAAKRAAAGGVAAGAAVAVAAPLRFTRRGRGMGWENFKCSCGKVVQISPAFSGKQVTCKNCRRKIDIVDPQP